MNLITECLHCHNKVLPDNKNICPACGNNVKRVPQINADKSKIVIDGTTVIPAVCIGCGRETDRTRTIIKYGNDKESAEYARREKEYYSRIGGIIGWAIYTVFKIGKQKIHCNYSGIRLSIPLILSLSKDKADMKTGSWFDKLTMSDLVNIDRKYLSSYNPF